MVGPALGEDLPWWRVVRSDGTLALGERQAKRLRAEGVEVLGSRVAGPASRRWLRGGSEDAP